MNKSFKQQQDLSMFTLKVYLKVNLYVIVIIYHVYLVILTSYIFWHPLHIIRQSFDVEIISIVGFTLFMPKIMESLSESLKRS